MLETGAIFRTHENPRRLGLNIANAESRINGALATETAHYLNMARKMYVHSITTCADRGREDFEAFALKCDLKGFA
jgi:hypothetical protein